MKVSLKNLYKNYGDTKVVKGIDLEMKDKEFIVLVGPSGCGKSTTLRMIAGLEDISSGDIIIGDKIVNHMSPSKRNVAMVFQDYALYPHMTVYDNMAFGLKMQKKNSEEIHKRVMQAAQMLDLGDYLERKPAALSGGQRQRVAMGRAVVKRSDVFLFDEPLSNLDAKLRAKMRVEIKKFHLKTKTTTIYVTHDQLEAMTLADQLVVMNNGIIEQVGTPLDVFQSPRTIFVATFIGTPAMNILPGRLENKNGMHFTSENGEFSFHLPESKSFHRHEGKKVMLGIRPSDIFVATDNDQLPHNWKSTRGMVEVVELLGKNAYLSLLIAGYECIGEVVGTTKIQPGDEVMLSFNLHHAHLFDPETSLNLIHLT